MRSKGLFSFKILMLAVFAFFVILPLANMFLNIRNANVAAIVSSEQFRKAAMHSLQASGVATLISVTVAMLLALSVTRAGIRFQGFFSVVLTLPMLIPSISHGMGLIILFGSNGILTRLFHLQSNIYGFRGIVVGSTLYAFPVAFLMLADILRYEDPTPYEAAKVLGIPRWRQFCSITLPYLKKSLLSVIFATFAMIVTDYGVPLMLGGQYHTLPVLMYQEVIGLLNFPKGSVIGSILLIPAVISFLLDLLNQEHGNQSFVSRRWEMRPSGFLKGFAYLYCSVICVGVCIPILSFALLTFVRKYPIDLSFTLANISKSIDMGAGRFLINSLIISFFAAFLGTAVSYVSAYLTARTEGKSSRLLHLFAISSMSVPGIVLGLSYVLFFKESSIYGTLIILIMVNVVHFISSPYLMAYHSLEKINRNLEAVGATLGIKQFQIFRDVLLPQSASTILEMISYFFVNSMMTISAVSFLSTIKNMPVALMLPQFEAQMLLECSAFVSIVILASNMIFKGVIYHLKRKVNEG